MDKFRVIQEEDTEDIKNLLVENVEYYYNCLVKDYKYSLTLSLVGCESPIEQMLALEIERIGINYFNLFNPRIEHMDTTNNKKIHIKGKTYRADILMEFIFKFDGNFMSYKLVIECDGFEYHKGNKAQIDIDYDRQSILLANGYDVIRFTGSAINKSPHICVIKIINHITTKYETIERTIK